VTAPLSYTPPTVTIAVRVGVVGFAYLFPTWDIAHQFLRGTHKVGSRSAWLHQEGGNYSVHSILTVGGNSYAFRYYETPQYHTEMEMEYVAWAIPDKYYTTHMGIQETAV
jgi:hypothetical protein